MTSPDKPAESADLHEGTARVQRSAWLVRPGRWAAPLAVLTAAVVISVYLLSGGKGSPAATHPAASRDAIWASPGPEHPGRPNTAATLHSDRPSPATGVAAHRRLHPGVAGVRARGTITVVVNNGRISVCSLIATREVNQIARARLSKPVPEAVGTFDECVAIQRREASSAARPLRVAWAVPPDPQPAFTFRQLTINLPRRDAVEGLGQRAYCSSQGPSSAELYVLDRHYLLEVFADTCAHLESLARIALARL